MFTIHTFIGKQYMGLRECAHSASLGGVIAHIIDDCTSFYVKDEHNRIVMRYRKEGMR